MIIAAAADGDALEVLKNLGVAGDLVAHVLGVDEVEDAELAAAEDLRRAGNKNSAGGTQIEIVGGLVGRVVAGLRAGTGAVGGEPVNQAEPAAAGAEFEETIAVIRCTVVVTVAGHDVDISTRIHGRSLAGIPNTAAVSIGGGAKSAGPRQRGGVVGHDPAVPRILVFVAGPADDHFAVGQGETGPLIFHFRVKSKRAI